MVSFFSAGDKLKQVLHKILYMCQILLWLSTGCLFVHIFLQGGIQFVCLFVSYSIHFLDFSVKGTLYDHSFTE